MGAHGFEMIPGLQIKIYNHVLKIGDTGLVRLSIISLMMG